MGSNPPAMLPVVNNVPAVPQVNANVPAVPQIAPAVIAQPISSIAIANSMFSALSNDTKFSQLSLAKDNWPKWKQKLLQVLGMSDLYDYIFGLIAKPDAAIDPTSARNWAKNHAKTISFLSMHIEDSELPNLVGVVDASVAWNNLLARHEQQGPITQVRLIQEALSVSYTDDVSSWPATTDRLRDICARIYSQVVPTQDVMFLVLMLNALEQKADHIRSEMTLYFLSNPTATSEVLANRINQEVVYKTKTESSPEIALAAQHKHAKSTKICSNCKRTGHLAETCFQKGGAMEGKKDDVLAAKAKSRADKGKTNAAGNANGIKRDQAGRAYILDAATGEAILLAESLAPAPADSALSAHIGDPFSSYPTWTNLNFSDADDDEYNALVTLLDVENPETSIDWCENGKEEIEPEALTTEPVNSSSRTQISRDSGPFILDSGASIHISPDRTDFIELRKISPRIIKGVSGTSISAIGIRKIHLRIAKGNTLILDPVLYVPQAAVRLISVRALASSQNLATHFNETGCWITKPCGATLASGALVGSKLYTLNLESSLAEHAFISTRVPSIETWHRRLGHLNARSIVEMSDGNMVRGMHIDLSSEPAKCQHCILGKQTRTPVPKLREGVKASGLLDCVYIDLTGPHVKSANGNSYVMNLIDNASSLIWSFPIPFKSSAIKALKDWVPTVERETGRTVSKFRVDNGELKSIEYADFCLSRGIKMQWTSPHTSSHNRRVERVHRTLFNSA
jgi:hypothetical protein